MIEEVEVLEYGLKLSGMYCGQTYIKVERVVYEAYQKHWSTFTTGHLSCIARTDSRYRF